MASNCRTIDAVPSTAFDFNTQTAGTITFFTNDLNINWRLLFQAPGILLNVHAGPILVVTSIKVGPGIRVTLSALTIGSAFAPPPLSLVQLQTDTIPQSPPAPLSFGHLEDTKVAASVRRLLGRIPKSDRNKRIAQ